MIGVYGANGFIGRHVVTRLAKNGHKVRAISRRFDRDFLQGLPENVDAIEADFSNSMAMLASLQDINAVVQLISSSSPSMGNRMLIEDIRENVIPHVSFLQSTVEIGIDKFVFISSGGTVYGVGAPVPTPETAHTNPLNSHGMTKLMIEKYIQMFSRVNELNYVILRVSNPFGPGQSFRKGQGLIAAALQRHREGRAIQIFGNGKSQRDYIYISDLVDAIETTVTRTDLHNQTLNIAKGEGRSVLEVLAAIETTLGVELAKEFIPARRTDVDVSILDISKARRLLSWSPDTPFQAGIEMMCAGKA